MTKMKNGKIISSQLLSKDTYSAMQKIIRRGKAKTTTVPENKPAENKPVEKNKNNENETQNKVETNTQNENKEENVT